MRRYYWAAKAVTQLNDVLLQNIEALLFPQESKTILSIPGEGNEHFIERQGVLDITDPQLFQETPRANSENLFGLCSNIQCQKSISYYFPSLV